MNKSATDPDSITGLTRHFAEFVACLRYDDLPPSVLDQAKFIMRDGIGNQVAASAISDSAKAVVALVNEWGGTAEATVVGYGQRLPAAMAGLCNATLGHGVELDDSHATGLLKAGSVLVPTALAVGEQQSASGKEALVALVAGYEVAVRIAKAINPGHRQRGYHTTSTVGTIGAAAIAAKLLNCDTKQIASAIGLAAMNSGGIQAYLDHPCMAKPLGPGRAAFNGILSGTLASRNFTGPQTALECREGFFNAVTDTLSSKHLSGLGSHWAILEVGFKPHSACRYAHGPIDVAQHFYRAEGVRIADIEAVEVGMSQLAIRQASKLSCPTLQVAMGSTEFGVALGLLGGSNGLRDYWNAFGNQAVHDLAARVTTVVEPEFGMGGRQALVKLRLRSGRVLRHRQEEPKGEPTSPLSTVELEAKFFATAGMVLDRTQAERLDRAVMAIDTEADVGTIPRLAVAPGEKPVLRAA